MNAYASLIIDETTGPDGRLTINRRTWAPRKKAKWRIELWAERKANVDDCLAAAMRGDAVAVGDLVRTARTITTGMMRFDLMLRDQLAAEIDKLLIGGTARAGFVVRAL